MKVSAGLDDQFREILNSVPGIKPAEMVGMDSGPGFCFFFFWVVRSEEFVEFGHFQLGVPFYGLLVWSWGAAGLLFW